MKKRLFEKFLPRVPTEILLRCLSGALKLLLQWAGKQLSEVKTTVTSKLEELSDFFKDEEKDD